MIAISPSRDDSCIAQRDAPTSYWSPQRSVQALTLRTPAELEAANAQLATEMTEGKQPEKGLELAHAELEIRVLMTMKERVGVHLVGGCTRFWVLCQVS
jgi:hypothetical protein